MKHKTITGYDFTVDKPLRALMAIRSKCKECCGGNYGEVARCEITDCTLWPYRFGKHPNTIAKQRAKATSDKA